MTVRITEIISRSEQGITRPFLCRADDGRLYYVKGNGAGRRSLVAEWMAGQIGQRIGLPIPDFKQTIVSHELIRFTARDDIHDLGVGVGFGSAVVENVDELPFLFIGQIDSVLRRKILLFDWWVCNADRTLQPMEATQTFCGVIAIKSCTSLTRILLLTPISPDFGMSTFSVKVLPNGRRGFATK